jgi:hypothetical protein
MMDSEGAKTLRKLIKRFTAIRLAEVTLFSLAAALIATAISRTILFNDVTGVLIGATISVAGIVTGILQNNLHHPDRKKMVRFLDYYYPALENSSDLLLKQPHDLTNLEKIQQDRVIFIFSRLADGIKIPNKLLLAFSSLVIALVIFYWLPVAEPIASASSSRPGRNFEHFQVLPPGIEDIDIRIDPPAYTKMKSYTTGSPALSVPANSVVRWKIVFNRAVHQANLLFSGGDSLALDSDGNTNRASVAIRSSVIYRIAWIDSAGTTFSSDFYKIQAVEDRSPEITITNTSQFTQFDDVKEATLPFAASLRDDYALTDAYIVATVSKGSGEAVKFREEKLRFSSPPAVSGKSAHVSRAIDLSKLDMEPGDELYFYVIAFDNRFPRPNYTRSETFFVTLRDTASSEMVVDGSPGADLMPEYFRSQRQIIIDSEKLLREKKQISREEFNRRSNELGYDQKVLRLRYGQFLGEEFETDIAGGRHDDEDSDHAHSDEEESDVIEKFGHTHDNDNEHNLLEDHHHHKPAAPGEQEDPLAPFVHSHDDPEEATFFSQAIRAKLKATLTIMWDAELHLRLFDPGMSLPFQYQALKLLKEISNDSRIYVHRTGFDAPPLKEDKRLTGDLEGLRSNTLARTANRKDDHSALRFMIDLAQQHESCELSTLSDHDKHMAIVAGNELASIVLERPGQYLETLTLLRRVGTGELNGAVLRNALSKIRADLYRMLPVSQALPGAKAEAILDVEQNFLNVIGDASVD